MSNETQNAPNGVASEKNSLERVAHIPIIEDLASQVLSIINANSYAAAIYSKGENMTLSLYNSAKPLEARLQPVTGLANAYANKTLDFAESKFPSAFKVHGADLVAEARKPADAALELFHSRLASAQASLSGVQDRVGEMYGKLPKNQEEISKGLNELVGELSKVRDNAVDNARTLPANVQEAVSPLVQSLSTGLQDIKTELSRTDATIQERAQNVLAYTRENASPVIQQTLDKLKSIIFKAKEESEKKADEVKEKADDVAN